MEGVTRTSESTPERFFPDRWSVAQSRGECPGERSTLPRALGVLTVGRAIGMPRLPFETGGPRLGIGPRFGRGPVVGTRMDGVDVGSARRLEGATRGGGMREEVAGLEGGAMRVGMLGGGLAMDGFGPEARWAEFMAGNEGGGRLSSSSSSSSSELSCSLSVNVGTAGALSSLLGAAFGVD